jgi:hypothetical protein
VSRQSTVVVFNTTKRVNGFDVVLLREAILV